MLRLGREIYIAGLRDTVPVPDVTLLTLIIYLLG